MPHPERCPFGHTQIEIVEEINSRQLTAAYRAEFDVNVGETFRGIEAVTFCQCNVCHVGFFHPATPGDAAFYGELARIPWYYTADKEEFRRAARRIAAHESVLEVGCGNGAFVRYLTEPHYVGLEYNPKAIIEARGLGLDVRGEDIVEFAASSKNQFGAVCAFQVLEHVPDPASFISACVTCARPGGLIIFGVPNAGAYLGLQPDELLNLPPHHLTWWSEQVFWQIAERFGVEVVAVEEERLEPWQCENYTRTVLLRAFMRCFRIQRTFFFDGFLHRLVKIAARAIGRIIRAGFHDKRLMPSGHTLIAVLRRVE